MQFSLLESDLSYIYSKVQSLLPKLHNANIFITGANGFFGIWLIESLLYLNKEENLNIDIYALSRSKESFYRKYPHLERFSPLKLVEGTVLDYSVEVEKLDYIVHAANLPFDNSADWATRHINYGIIGTQNIFETAKKHDVQSILITSSGAVYRNFDADIPFKEDDLQVDCSYASVYAQTKKVTEQLAKDFSERENIPCAITRCFAFAGAYLPLESFAFGEFIKNAILGEDIIIKSDGQATRSYLYATDLVVCLLTILLQNKAFNLYNIGSDKGISLKELAKAIGDKYTLQVKVLGKEDKGNAPKAYVPNIEKFQSDYTLNAPHDLEYCIEKMYAWNKRFYIKREV